MKIWIQILSTKACKLVSIIDPTMCQTSHRADLEGIHLPWTKDSRMLNRALQSVGLGFVNSIGMLGQAWNDQYRSEVDRFHVVLSQRPTSLAYVESCLLVYHSDASNKQHLRSKVTHAWHEFCQKFGVSSFYGG